MTKFMITNRTDAWKTDVNLLNVGAQMQMLVAYGTRAPLEHTMR